MEHKAEAAQSSSPSVYSSPQSQFHNHSPDHYQLLARCLQKTFFLPIYSIFVSFSQLNTFNFALQDPMPLMAMTLSGFKLVISQ